MIKISSSILSADFANLGRDIQKLEAAGSEFIHLDIMDGNFVPNLTIGPAVVKTLRPYSDLPFEAHLMVQDPDLFIPLFVEAGVDIIIVHLEACKDIFKTINLIKSFNKKIGVSIKPETSEILLKDIMLLIDLVLVMTVNPGFGGQKFLNEQCQKIANICAMRFSLKHDVLIEVDGGINNITAPLVKQAGADILVSGSYIFNHPLGIAQAIKELKHV